MENNMNRVAVYGSLREGMGNHAILQGEGTRFVKKDLVYGYVMISFVGFPAIVPAPQSRIPVTVEIYEVSDEVFRKLDMLEGYPDFYDRCMLDGEASPTWLYFIDDKELLSRPVVTDGDWVEYKGKSYERS